VRPPEEPDDESATPPPGSPVTERDTETTRMPLDGEPTRPQPTPSTSAGWAASTPPPATAPPPEDPTQGTAPSVLWAQPTPASPSQLEVPGAPGLSFADTGGRFVAWLIDSIIVGIVGSVIGAALGYGRTTVIQDGVTTSANVS